MDGLTIKEWAQLYLDHGWQVVPLAPQSKRVTATGWLTLEFTPDDFQDDDNLGLRSVDGLVFVDVDCAEAVRFADHYLPDTASIYGRPSTPSKPPIWPALSNSAPPSP